MDVISVKCAAFKLYIDTVPETHFFDVCQKTELYLMEKINSINKK